MKAYLGALRTLRSLVTLPRFAVAGLILLGLASALMEGLSISLVIPLIQRLTGGAASGLAERLFAPFSAVPAPWRAALIALAILLCVVAKNALGYVYTALSSGVNASIGHQLRSGILRRLLGASQSFLDRQDSGRLMNALAHDTWRATAAFETLASLFTNVSLVAIFAVLMLFVAWGFAIVSTVALIAISVLIRWLTRRARLLGEQALEANQESMRRLVEVFGGMRVIRAFGREPYEQERYDRASREIRRTFFRMDLMSASVGPAGEILITVLLIGLLLYAIRHPASLGASVSFLLILYRIQPRVRRIDSDRVALRTLAPSLAELASIAGSAQPPRAPAGKRRLGPLRRGIEFDAVTLRYDSGAAPALARASFQVPAGRTTALVGPSGAGKSTVVSLICRLYEATEGAIRVDGVPIEELDLRWWREQTALVSQDVYLFNATVAENIAYGRPEAREEEIVLAAQRANALAFIEALPDGFGTVLGDRGLRLSGGQRQRIALARALIRAPQLLILDEATNALDSIAERVVRDALASFGSDRTVLVIAHRSATLEQADHVVVLDAGRVVERGPPQVLRSARGLYAVLQGS